MKFKLKFLAAAALALSSASGFAQIVTTADPSLLFIAYDVTGSGATYARNLGSLSSIGGAADTLFNAPAGSIFGTQMTGVAASNIVWGVFALNNDVNIPTIYLTGKLSNLTSKTATDVASIANLLTGGLNTIPQYDLASNGYRTAAGEYTGSPVLLNQTNGLTAASQWSFGNAVLGQGVGSSLNFLQVAGDVDNDVATATQLYTNSQLSAFNGNAKGGYFTLLDAAGDLKWVATAGVVAAVPLPAAGFLLAPGVMALLGLRRRRDTTAA